MTKNKKGISSNMDIKAFCIHLFKGLPEGDVVENIREDKLNLIDHGERKIAIENLRYNLYKYKTNSANSILHS